jgi:hypothetical protein
MTIQAPRRAIRALAVLALALATACASLRLGDEQRAYYLREAGTFAYPKSCLDVWPSVLAALGSKGYPLKGRDRAYGGEGKQSGFASVVDQASETRAVEGGGLAVRTGWNSTATGSTRYEVTGNPAPPSGCAVTFTLITTGTVDPSSEQRETDWRIQMEMMRRVDPESAARIDAGAPKGG